MFTQSREAKFHPNSGQAIFNTIYTLAKSKKFEQLACFLDQQEICSVNYRYGYYNAPYQLARDGQNDAAEALVTYFDANISDVAEGWAENGDEERALNALQNRGADITQVVRGFAAAGNITQVDLLTIDLPLTQLNAWEVDQAITPAHREKFFGYAKLANNLTVFFEEVKLFIESFNDSLAEINDLSADHQNIFFYLSCGKLCDTIFAGFSAAKKLDMATEFFNMLHPFYDDLGEDSLREALNTNFLIAGKHDDNLDRFGSRILAEYGRMRAYLLFTEKTLYANRDHYASYANFLAFNGDIKLLNQYLTYKGTSLCQVMNYEEMALKSHKELKRFFYLLPPTITVEYFKSMYTEINFPEGLLEHANQLREFRLYDGMSYPLAIKWDFKIAMLFYLRSELLSKHWSTQVMYIILEFYTGLPHEWIAEMAPGHKRYLENSARANVDNPEANAVKYNLIERLSIFPSLVDQTNTAAEDLPDNQEEFTYQRKGLEIFS